VGECVRCVFVVSCYLKKRKRRRRRIMVTAPITKAIGILWVCEISSSSHLFEDFFGYRKNFFFF
jgi:hypothetical protein